MVMALTLSACGAKKEVGNERPGQRMLDFGQPEAMPSLSGLVKSVLGNEVTILKIERPSFDKETTKDREKSNDSEKKTTLSLGVGTGMGKVRGMGGVKPGGERDEDTMIAMMKTMSTSEEKVIIPVGIRMLKNDSEEAGKPEMVEATLEDIKQDTMLMIWLDESVSDRQVAKFVVVK